MTELNGISIEEASQTALAYFDVESESLAEAERVTRFEAARQIMAGDPETAAGRLAFEFETGGFQRKAAAYRLIIGLGKRALPALHARLGGAGVIGCLWLVSILHYHEDFSRTGMLADLAQAKTAYVRHLAVLALVFQGRQDVLDRDLLIKILAEALLSNEKIEGSAFFVADSALSCLRVLTGETFADGSTPAIHFYNFDHFLFSPPVHPFPYTSDRVNTLSHRQKRQLADRVRDWWEQGDGRGELKRMTSCFEQ